MERWGEVVVVVGGGVSDRLTKKKMAHKDGTEQERKKTKKRYSTVAMATIG